MKLSWLKRVLKAPVLLLLDYLRRKVDAEWQLRNQPPWDKGEGL